MVSLNIFCLLKSLQLRLEKSERVPQSPKNIIVLSKLNQNLIDSFEKSETVPVADYLKRRHLKFNLLWDNLVNI